MQRLGPLILLGVVVLTSFGCPVVDLGENPPDPQACRPDPVYFRDKLWPEFVAPADPMLSCVNEAGCHRIEDGRSALRLNPTPTSQGDHDANYSTVTRFLNCGFPEASPMLTKPMSTLDSHGGGDMFPDTLAVGTQRFIFEDWFNQ
jgi:hypothetical protein